LPAYGRSAEIEVLSLFRSALKRIGVGTTSDDPLIEFSLSGSHYTVKHFHSRSKGRVVRGIEHNCDLVVWSNDRYVAYVEVKRHAGDLKPSASREFVGKVIWKQVDDAIMTSMTSTINRWQLLDRYGIMNTGHILQAKNAGVEFREWPERIVEKWLKTQLGASKTLETVKKQRQARTGKIAELLAKHHDFDGIGFKFVEPGKNPRPITDEDFVINSPYAAFRCDDQWVLTMKFGGDVTLSNLYETLATHVDLGADRTVIVEGAYANSNVRETAKQMGFEAFTKRQVEELFHVDIDSMPLWGIKFGPYPLRDIGNAGWSAIPDCVKNALEGVPDGVYETSCMLATLAKAFRMDFDWRKFAEKCWSQIQEKWLGYVPAKTKEDTFLKVKTAVERVRNRHEDPQRIPCSSDTLGAMGPKALDALFHLNLTSSCKHCLQGNDLLEYVLLNATE
jgi:hypothetical protein